MKNILFLIALTMAMFSSVICQETNLKIFGKHDVKDIKAIQDLVSDTMNNGWEKYDVEKSVAEYTDDAFFINAFGIEKYGKEEIKKFLTKIFAAPGFRNRKLRPLQFISIRFIRPDIANVHTYQETTDQLKADGTPEGLRKTHVFRIMHKRNGKWLTDSFQVMDVRQ